MSTPSVRIGASAPEFYRHTITTTTDGYVADLTTVIAARLKVRRPDGQLVTWPATIESASTTQLVIKHEYALDGSDLDVLGPYRVHPEIQTAAGWFPCSVSTFTVEDF